MGDGMALVKNHISSQWDKNPKKNRTKNCKKIKNCIFRVVIRAFEKLLVWIDTVFSWHSRRINRFWPNLYIWVVMKVNFFLKKSLFFLYKGPPKRALRSPERSDSFFFWILPSPERANRKKAVGAQKARRSGGLRPSKKNMPIKGTKGPFGGPLI